uniref:Putative terminase n=1 Tax=viral metagenome TaxID=1070528 RepID=A0A6M3K616_9ZZZZ
MKKEPEALWTPTPKQEEFLSRWEFEVFYGGAAGPGKTDAIVMGALRHVDKPSYRGLLLRRTFPRLAEILERTREYYPQIIPGCHYSGTDHKWIFPSGATIMLGHMEHESDKYGYRGHEFGYIGIDELTEFTLTQYLFLFTRCRSTRDISIKPMIRSASNPCDIGHLWVKERFVTITEPGKTFTDSESGLSRIFIPGLMEDNPHLYENDPDYEKRLKELPEIDYKRFRFGIWDVFEGQIFTELNKDVHGYNPKTFTIPPDWERYHTFDWGYAKPASVGWYAVDYDGKIWRYREWYVGKRDEATKSWQGLRMSPTEIARGIKERERGENVRPGPADPSIWHKRVREDHTVGPSVAEEMTREGVYFLKGDNDRILGKQQFHSRLRLDDGNQPNIYISTECENWWRTIPELREDEKNPEDLDTRQEDHCYDETRYMCMFRPLRPRVQPKGPPRGSFMDERRRYIKAKQYADRYGENIDSAYQRIK